MSRLLIDDPAEELHSEVCVYIKPVESFKLILEPKPR